MLIKALFALVALAALCNVPAWARLSMLAVSRRNVTTSVLCARIGLFFVSMGLALGSYWRMGALFFQTSDPSPIPLLVPVLVWNWPPVVAAKVMVPAASVGLWAALLLIGEVALLVGSSVALLRERRGCPGLVAFVLGAPVVVGVALFF